MYAIRTVLVAALSTALATPAFAGGSDTTDHACGSVSAGWNAPNGALVLNRGKGGPVTPVIGAVGEYRTHSMISHGYAGDPAGGVAGWVTHETMHTPGTENWPDACSNGPLRPSELRYGYPGASQTTQGGIYNFLYGGQGQDAIHFQKSRNSSGFNGKGAEVANFMWGGMRYWWVTSKKDGGQGFYRVGGLNPDFPNPLNYSLYQYRDHWNTNVGWIGHNNGMVCSTMIAYAQYMKGWGEAPEKTYGHDLLVSAGNALYNAVDGECDAGILATIACFEDVCDDAARQVRNCMAANACESDDSAHWNNVANNAGAVAVSVSPDKLGGWSGNHWTTEGGSSLWAYDGQNSLAWNQGGSSYSCWF